MDSSSPTPLFDQVNLPADLKKLPREQLEALCAELRQVIMDTVAVTGGHLGSGMGVVELTVALHYLYDFSDDRLVWDVGHQCYPHKLLTGRKDRFHTLRQKDGLSGFSNKWESEYDAYLMGHAGTAASAALGIAMGDRMQGRDRHSVAVVGDADLPEHGVAGERGEMTAGCDVGLDRVALSGRPVLVVADAHHEVVARRGRRRGRRDRSTPPCRRRSRRARPTRRSGDRG